MAGELRAPYVATEPLAEGESSVRSPYVTSEPLTEGSPSIRGSYVDVEPLTEGSPNLRGNYVAVEPLSEGFRNLVCPLVCVELLQPVAPEEYMSTELFPGCLGSSISLPGITYSVGKKPTFRTNKHKAASGPMVRNALMEMPIWVFTFAYEYLPDNNGTGSTQANSSLKSLMGFFLSRTGGFDTFLFKDGDDYLVENNQLGIGDGLVTQFYFRRNLGGFNEIVGQVDTGETVTLYFTIEEATSIPATPGPYTVTVAEAASFVEDLGVLKGGVPMTAVTGAPAAGEYAVDVPTGVYTFNATDESDAIVITYRYEIDAADYTVTMPNLVVFDTAPPADAIISADFQFFFVCVFQEDEHEYEKFMDKLWELQECTFESTI